jgi:Skp family chaperone for outer membrane proteins
MSPMRPLGVLSVVVIVVAALVIGAWNGGWLSKPPAGATTGNVAVVDIEAVAKQVGADLAVERQIKDAEASLNSQLGSLQASLKRQYADKAKELLPSLDNRAAPPADATAAKQQLAEFERNLNQQLLQAQQNARSQFAAYRSSLFVDFRTKVVPIARKIASQQGCGVVLTKNDTVLLAVDEAHDITSAVAEEMRKGAEVAKAALSKTSNGGQLR